MARAVAITGLGVVTALGVGAASLDAAVSEGLCGIRRLTRFASEGRCALAAEAPDPPIVAAGLDEASRRRLSRVDRFALAAAEEAFEQAGVGSHLRATTALFVGATTAGMRESEDAYRRRRAGLSERFRVSEILGTFLSTPAAVVAQGLGCYGPRTTVSTACSSSALAIGAAVDAVRHGRAPIAIVVGCDQLSQLTYAGFDALQALDAGPCRPFDRERRGLSLGEGAAALVLEDAEHARARGASILGFVLGWGTSTDAHHVTAPHPEGAGAVRAFVGALADAGCSPEAVGYVNAHGTGTKQNDEVEVGVLRSVFGGRLARVPVSSSKSQFGHTLGAAGAIEAAVTLIALRAGVLPPTVNLTTPEWPDLDFVRTPGRKAMLGVAATSSYGFGGHNVTLILGHPEAT